MVRLRGGMGMIIELGSFLEYLIVVSGDEGGFMSTVVCGLRRGLYILHNAE